MLTYARNRYLCLRPGANYWALRPHSQLVNPSRQTHLILCFKAAAEASSLAAAVSPVATEAGHGSTVSPVRERQRERESKRERKREKRRENFWGQGRRVGGWACVVLVSTQKDSGVNVSSL